MEERTKCNKTVLWSSLVLLVFCVQSLKAEEISDNEMANVKGSSWVGWMCGYCWDACESMGAIGLCESVSGCYEDPYGEDVGDACAQIGMDTSTPNETIMWCYSGQTTNQIYCDNGGEGEWNTCSAMVTCSCWDPAGIGGICQLIYIGDYRDQDNC